MLTVTFVTAAFAECWPYHDPPPDVDGILVGTQGCLVQGSLAEGCVDRFDLTEGGCCPSFRQVLHTTGWAGQPLTQPADGTIAVRCADEYGAALDLVRLYDPDDADIEYRAYFESDGTMVALRTSELTGYYGTDSFTYRTWCCGGDFSSSSLWWGDRDAVELAYFVECGPSDDTFTYAPADIIGTADADPGCDTPPEPARDPTEPPADCGCAATPATGGALVGMLGLLAARARTRGRRRAQGSASTAMIVQSPAAPT